MSKKFDKNSIKQSPIRKSKSLKRTLIKAKGILPKDAIFGKIVATVGSLFIVKSDESYFECIIGGTLISEYVSATLAATGDEVWFTLDDSLDDSFANLKKGIIRKIGKRWTKLSRKLPGRIDAEQILASNADQVVIVMAAVNPFYNKRLIDRYQIAAELGDLKVIICINKIDLLNVDEIKMIEEDLSVYKDLGDDIIFISAENGDRIDVLRNTYLKDKVSIFSGPSGVGKSTLVNQILGGHIQKVKAISETTAKGMHTTSFTKLFELPEGGSIIDSPGIREFALWDITQEELPLYFRDFQDYYLNCKYSGCTHIHEPGCAVIKALEDDKIQIDRYESYLNLYDSMK